MMRDTAVLVSECEFRDKNLTRLLNNCVVHNGRGGGADGSTGTSGGSGGAAGLVGHGSAVGIATGIGSTGFQLNAIGAGVTADEDKMVNNRLPVEVGGWRLMTPDCLHKAEYGRMLGLEWTYPSYNPIKIQQAAERMVDRAVANAAVRSVHNETKEGGLLWGGTNRVLSNVPRKSRITVNSRTGGRWCRISDSIHSFNLSRTERLSGDSQRTNVTFLFHTWNLDLEIRVGI